MRRPTYAQRAPEIMQFISNRRDPISWVNIQCYCGVYPQMLARIIQHLEDTRALVVFRSRGRRNHYQVNNHE
jgi:hypothetical protein